MKTTGDIARERYQRRLQGAEKVTRAVALFALQMACADIGEVWQDEYAGIRQKCSVLLDERDELQRQLEQLQRMYDALEAECISRRTTINELSAPTTASMGSCAPGASSTSSTEAGTPSEPAASSTVSADPAAPASSAPTSRPRRSKKSPLPSAKSAAASAGSATGNPLAANPGEVGDTTGLDPTRQPSPHIDGARRLLANPADLDSEVELLEQGKIQWRDNPRPLRLALMAHLWQRHWSKVSEFDRSRPAWMPTAGAISSLSSNNRWSEIVLSIFELKLPPSATQA